MTTDRHPIKVVELYVRKCDSKLNSIAFYTIDVGMAYSVHRKTV